MNNSILAPIALALLATTAQALPPDGKWAACVGINMADDWRPYVSIDTRQTDCVVEIHNLNRKSIEPLVQSLGFALPAHYRADFARLELTVPRSACRFADDGTDGFEVNAEAGGSLYAQLPSFYQGEEVKQTVPVKRAAIRFARPAPGKGYLLSYQLQDTALDPNHLVDYIGTCQHSLTSVQYQAVQAFYQEGTGTLRCRDPKTPALDLTVQKHGDTFEATALRDGQPIWQQKYAQNVRTEFDAAKYMALIQFGQPAGAPAADQLELWLDNYFPYDFDTESGWPLYGSIHLKLGGQPVVDTIQAQCRLE